MRKEILYVLFLVFFSCKEKSNTNVFDLNKNDKIYTKASKIPASQLTKIEIPQYIDLDTIQGNQKIVDITIKNKGSKKLTSLFIKPPCSCIEMPKYDTVLNPNESQTISINMKFDEVGNFYEPVTIYGSFYPYIKKVYIEGYRLK